MTDDELRKMVDAAVARYNVLTPEEKNWHDYKQRRSLARGMCPSHYSYEEWCRIVDRMFPFPLAE